MLATRGPWACPPQSLSQQQQAVAPGAGQVPKVVLGHPELSWAMVGSELALEQVVTA